MHFRAAPSGRAQRRSLASGCSFEAPRVSWATYENSSHLSDHSSRGHGHHASPARQLRPVVDRRRGRRGIYGRLGTRTRHTPGTDDHEPDPERRRWQGAASISAPPMLPDEQKIEDVSRDGAGLLLKYILEAQGMQIPAKILLSPVGDKWKASFDFDGMALTSGNGHEGVISWTRELEIARNRGHRKGPLHSAFLIPIS